MFYAHLLDALARQVRQHSLASKHTVKNEKGVFGNTPGLHERVRPLDSGNSLRQARRAARATLTLLRLQLNLSVGALKLLNDLPEADRQTLRAAPVQHHA